MGLRRPKAYIILYTTHEGREQYPNRGIEKESNGIRNSSQLNHAIEANGSSLCHFEDKDYNFLVLVN